MVNPSSETVSLANACVMLPKHRGFVRSEIGAVCLNVSMPSAVETFVQQVLNGDSGMKGSAEVVSVVWMYVSAMDQIQVRRMELM